ncbi:aminoglycoside phosphotransferase family protein [Halorubrum sp. AD140]|uniref:phosphotransferase family protein n=1 Tax=Halorubrum sp. AD140 TaxID=3050073 RepID=UPI002ACCF410|nr:aminoglycoside phosphotransferase family protein [Halorubrum sp. AD140]MDZ5812576.1 aminoglycoside phosphotransferase family protein [Halorubrum sp. AD140]
MNEAVATVLGEAFPDRSVERLTAAGVSWNGANETVGVVFADGARAFCKVAVDGDGTRVARELAVLRHVTTRRPIAAPEVLAADSGAGVPYLITAPAPGRELLGVWEELGEGDGGEADREALLRRVGATLATLHAARFDRHAEIVGGDGRGGLDLDPAPWPDVLLKTIDRTREIGTSERLADHYDAVIDCVEANRDRLCDAPAALLHGDVAMPNLFVDDAGAGRGGGVEEDDGLAPIDWELADVGDPARDLVRAEDQLLNGFDSEGPERYAAALRAGYRERAGGLPEGFAARRPVYEVVRMLGRSGFIDQWTTHLDEPTDALVERAEAELRARLAAV